MNRFAAIRASHAMNAITAPTTSRTGSVLQVRISPLANRRTRLPVSRAVLCSVWVKRPYIPASNGRALRTAVALAAVALTSAVPPAHAEGRASLVVSASTGLAEGQRITLDGSGFQPGLAAIAVGLCKSGYKNGLKDCDLEGGATFVNIAADGTFPTVTLTVRPRFRDIDCTTQQCVLAAAPLPGSEPQSIIDANSAQVPVGFAGAQPSAVTSVPISVAVQSDSETRGPSAALWTVTAVLLSIIAVFTLADRRRL